MEQTLTALRDFLETRRGFDAFFIAPSRSMARQLLDAYAARYGGALGLRPHTPDSLALELCGPDCPGLLTDGAAALLVLKLLREKGADMPYFFGLREGGFTLPAARGLLEDLQLLEREGAALPEAPEDPRLAGLAALFREYRREKERRQLWDRYDLFAAARDRLRRRPLSIPAALCANVTGEGAVRAFLEQLHAQVLPVPSAEPAVSAPALFLPQTERAPSAALRFVQGYGRENEALYPFYDLLERQIPFGQAAILWAGSGDPALLRDQAARLEVPLTLDGGVPLGDGPLLSLLRRLAAWYDGGCPVEGLPDLMACGLVPPQGPGLLRFLRKNHVGYQLPRYFDCLTRAGEALAPDGSEAELRTALERWTGFFQEIEGLFDRSTGAGDGLARLKSFLLEYYVKFGPELRAPEYAALISALEGMLALSPDGPFRVLLPALLDGAARTPCRSAPPRDGAVHAAPLSRGVFLDRPYTYILGLERDALTAPGRESPLLRNEERRALGLPLSGAGAELPLYHLGTVLAAARGEVTLSYSCFDTEKLLATPPSPVYERLRNGAPPALFGYRRPVSLTGADLWLEGGARPAPSPGAGTADREELTDFRFSASSLELAMECPRRFYFQYLLGVPQEEKTELTGRTWLPANAFGSLVHETLEDYFSQLIRTKTPPDFAPLWSARLETYRRLWPCANPALEEREARRAEDTVKSALRHFEKAQTGSTPLAAELTFGRETETPQPFGMPEDFNLRLDRDLSFRFTGSVDRLDRLPSGGLRVLDYKTGSASRFYQRFEEKLQYYLYAASVRQLLGQPVERAEYLFLTAAGVRTLGVDDPGQQPACLARLKVLMELLRGGGAAGCALPVWRDGQPVCEADDPERQKRLRGCVHLCPYAELCQEVRP